MSSTVDAAPAESSHSTAAPQPAARSGSSGGATSQRSPAHSRLRGLSYKDGADALSPDSPAAASIAQRGFGGASSRVAGGEALRFKESTGKDVSGTREHTGPEAQEACRALGNVQAYSADGQVAYRDPSPSPQVRHHELAHVAQHADGVQAHGGLGGRSGLESNADSVADAVVSGRPATVTPGAPGLAFKKGGSYGQGKVEVKDKSKKQDYQQVEEADPVEVSADELTVVKHVAQLIKAGRKEEAYTELAGQGRLVVTANVIKKLDQDHALDSLLNALGYAFLYGPEHRLTTRSILGRALPENNVRRVMSLVVGKVKIKDVREMERYLNAKGKVKSRKKRVEETDEEGKTKTVVDKKTVTTYVAKKGGKDGLDDESFAAYQIIKSLPSAEQKQFLTGQYADIYANIILVNLNTSQLESDDLNFYSGGEVDSQTGEGKDLAGIKAQLADDSIWTQDTETKRAQLEGVLRMALAAGLRQQVVTIAKERKAYDTPYLKDILDKALGPVHEDDGARDMTRKEAKKAQKGDSRGALVEGIDLLGRGKFGGRSGRMGRVGDKTGDKTNKAGHTKSVVKNKRKDGYQIEGLELDELQDMYGQEKGVAGFKFAQAGLDDRSQQKKGGEKLTPEEYEKRLQNGTLKPSDYLEDDDINRIDAVVSWDKGLLYVDSPGLALEKIDYPYEDMTLKSGFIQTGLLKFQATFPPKKAHEDRTLKSLGTIAPATMRLTLATATINDLMIIFADSMMVIDKITLEDVVIEAESKPGSLLDMQSADDAMGAIMATDSLGKGLTGLGRLVKGAWPGLDDMSAGLMENAFIGAEGGGVRIHAGNFTMVGLTMSDGTHLGKLEAKNLDFRVKRVPSEVLAERSVSLQRTIERQSGRRPAADAAVLDLEKKLAELGAGATPEAKKKVELQLELARHQVQKIDEAKAGAEAELQLVQRFLPHAAELDRWVGPGAKGKEGEEAPEIVKDYKAFMNTSGGVGLIDADALRIEDVGTSAGENYGDIDIQGLSAMGGGQTLQHYVGLQTESFAGKGKERVEGGKYAADDQLRANIDALTISNSNAGVPNTTAGDVKVTLEDAPPVEGADGKTTSDPTKKLSIQAGTASSDIVKFDGLETDPIVARDLGVSVTGSQNILDATLNDGDPKKALYGQPQRVTLGLGSLPLGPSIYKSGSTRVELASATVEGLTADATIELELVEGKTKLRYGKFHSLALPLAQVKAASFDLPVDGQVARVEIPEATIAGMHASDIPLTGFDPFAFEGKAGWEEIRVQASANLGESVKAGMNLDVGKLDLGVTGDKVKFDLDGLKASDIFVERVADEGGTKKPLPGTFARFVEDIGGRIKQIGEVGTHLEYDKKTGEGTYDFSLSAIDVAGVNAKAAGIELGAASAFLGPVNLNGRIELDPAIVEERVKAEEKQPPLKPFEVVKKVHVDDFSIGKLEGNGLSYKGGGNDVAIKKGYFEELAIKGVTFDPSSNKSILPFLTDFDVNLKEAGIEGLVGRFKTGAGANDIVKASLTTHVRGISVKRANNGKTSFELKDFDVDQASVDMGHGDVDVAGVLKNFGAGFTLSEGGITGGIRLGSLVASRINYSGFDPKEGKHSALRGGPASLSDMLVTVNIGLKKTKTAEGKDGVGLNGVTIKKFHIGPTNVADLEIVSYTDKEIQSLGRELSDRFGLSLNDEEAKRFADLLVKAVGTKSVKNAGFSSLDLADVKLFVPGEQMVKSKSFDLKGLDVDVHNGPLGVDLGEFLKLKGDIHAGEFSFDSLKDGGKRVVLNDFNADEFAASYQGIGGTLREMNASKVDVNLGGRDEAGEKKASTVEVENVNVNADLNDTKVDRYKSAGAEGKPGYWPESEQRWNLPLLDDLDGMLLVSIPFRSTFLDLPVVVDKGQINVVPAFIAKALVPHQFAIADEVATPEMRDAIVAGGQGLQQGLGTLGMSLIEDLLAPVVVSLINYFSPDTLKVRTLVENAINTKFGRVYETDPKKAKDLSLQEMMDDVVADMGNMAILVDYFGPKGQGFFKSTGLAIWDWCASFFRSDERNQEVQMEKIKRRAKILVDAITNIHIGDMTHFDAEGSVYATRAPVRPGIDATGDPVGHHLIGKHQTYFTANSSMSVKLAGSLNEGLSMGASVKFNSFNGNFGAFSIEGEGLETSVKDGSTLKSEVDDEGNLMNVGTEDAGGELHVKKAKLTLATTGDVLAQQEADRQNLAKNGTLAVNQDYVFKKVIGRGPLNDKERQGFQNMTGWLGWVSFGYDDPFEMVNNFDDELYKKRTTVPQ